MRLFVIFIVLLYPRPTACWRHCNQDNYKPVGYDAGMHDRAARSILPIQQAAVSILNELQTGDLLPEMVEPAASFALALVAVYDAFDGQCADHETTDALSHGICAAYVSHAGGLGAACTGRLRAGGALSCACADLRGGIVGVCNAGVLPPASGVPLCYSAQEAACRPAFWGLCEADPGPGAISRLTRRVGSHLRHQSKPKHASFAGHAAQQQATRWAHRAQQRMHAAHHPKGQPPPAVGTTDLRAGRRGATVPLPTPPGLAFLFLLSSNYTLNNIAATRRGQTHTHQPVVCAMGAEARAAAKIVLSGSHVAFRVGGVAAPDNLVGLLLDGSCDALALWWGQAETIYTNPCDHGAGRHPFCAEGVPTASAVGHRLLKDPQGQTVTTSLPTAQATLAAHAEHDAHRSRSCRHALQASPHHHLPHC